MPKTEQFIPITQRDREIESLRRENAELKTLLKQEREYTQRRYVKEQQRWEQLKRELPLIPLDAKSRISILELLEQVKK